MLRPGAADERNTVLKLTERAVTGTEKDPTYGCFQLVRGQAEYYSGHYKAAARWLDGLVDWAERLPQRDWRTNATAFAMLAMTQYRLGRPEEARRSLAAARAIVAQQMPDPAKGRPFADNWYDWRDWLHAQHFLHEAEELLRKETGDRKQGAPEKTKAATRR